MPVLLAGSIVCTAVILERIWMLRRSRIFPPRIERQLNALLGESKITDALAVCRASDAPLARIVADGLDKLDEPKDELKEILEASGKREISTMETRLDLLATLAAVGPLLGLLGTVVGMIRTFMVVGATGLGDPIRLSRGIAEALLCTAAGMIVAIPAFIFHRYFLNRIDRMALELEAFARKVLKLSRMG
ncbi:MAG: MotA/TolQ/ExbB proton channel family protein [Pseudomonadota bacterium]